jgi:4-hydroxybenzoate polyprenyltransferase
MCLIDIQRNRLPCPKGLIYKESDFGLCHESELMSEDGKLPEAEVAAGQVSAGQVADAPRGNWVDVYAPATWRPYLRLSRADRPIGTWLLFAPCLWGIALAMMVDAPRLWDIWLILSCGLGAFLMRGAGCTWNDLADRDIDAQVARTRSRPLPSGQVSPRGAVIWMVAQALAAALILFTYNWLAVGLGVASLALVMIYPFAKRFTWWPQMFLGLAFNWGAILAYAAHTGRIDLSAVMLYFAGITWTLFYDTIYAHQDREDDALIGVKSTARLFGDSTRVWLQGFMGLCLMLLLLAVVLLPIRETTDAMRLLQSGVAIAGIWAFGWHLVWQMRRLNLDDPASCLVVFRANRDAGLILGLIFAFASFL